MVRVFIENQSPWSSYCEQIATFANEDLYDVARPALELLAGRLGCVLTESIEEEA